MPSGVERSRDYGDDRDAEEDPRDMLQVADLRAELREPAILRPLTAQDRALLDDGDRHEDGGADPEADAVNRKHVHHVHIFLNRRSVAAVRTRATIMPAPDRRGPVTSPEAGLIMATRYCYRARVGRRQPVVPVEDRDHVGRRGMCLA